MVRYPKSIAYGFKIDQVSEKMKIPKFTIQPWSNYFAHGVRLYCKDNVISVKESLQGKGKSWFLVTDNGRGMKKNS